MPLIHAPEVIAFVDPSGCLKIEERLEGVEGATTAFDNP
jgi:hypothetical protein